jgi:hypothetical protein
MAMVGRECRVLVGFSQWTADPAIIALVNDPEVGNVEGIDQGEHVSGDDEPDDTFHDPTGIVDRDDPIEEGHEERVPVDEGRLDFA